MPKKTIIIGYGNQGRLDDGLGPALINRLEGLGLDQQLYTLTSDYQLSVELAKDIAEHDEVIFVDACIDGSKPYFFKPVAVVENNSLGSHTISPEALMQLTQCLFHVRPKASILGIRGHEFDEFGERLSVKAQENLESAFSFITKYISENSHA